jgi:hypothetical protein
MALVEADCQPPGLARYVTLPAGSLTQRAPDPRKNTGAMVVGVAAFSGSLRGSRLVPAKGCYLVPPTSTPKGHNASR